MVAQRRSTYSLGCSLVFYDSAVQTKAGSVTPRSESRLDDSLYNNQQKTKDENYEKSIILVRFLNLSDKPGKVLCVQSPSGIEELFEHMSLLAHAGPPDPNKMKELSRQIRNRVSAAFEVNACAEFSPLPRPEVLV
jgi:hypothetical protein